MPVVIVGANVVNKPNFMTIAWCGIVENDPPMISISASKKHYTNIGIHENKTFSINIPTKDIVELTDYVGIKSGKEIDKSSLFSVFYGDLENAPMIEEAPLNLECKLHKIVNLGESHDFFIGEIINVFINEDCLEGGIPDIQKINPIIYSTKQRSYWSIGKKIGEAWNIGKNYQAD
ncbi:MAG: flavin reductase family protein [Candidatus Lokiarchaeota archaeon]|nr:flavin reductase family protein [Candidatus Lokiarchaeota archaeon]MBD3199475.1 flavin reductase family protein [Candidatus Lokiarchaeota archaeon]